MRDTLRAVSAGYELPKLPETASFWDLATSLLARWQSNPARGVALVGGHNDPRTEDWEVLVAEVERAARARALPIARTMEAILGHAVPGSDADLRAADGQADGELLGQLASLGDHHRSLLGADVDHAIAWGIDLAVHETFAYSWTTEDVHVLRPDEFFYKPEPDPRVLWGSALEPTVRPSTLLGRDPRIATLPRIRTWTGDAGVSVRIDRDPGNGELREALLGGAIATLHPNVSFAGEFETGGTPAKPMFPIAPSDSGAQTSAYLQLIGEARAAGATAMVSPELSATPDVVAAVRNAIDAGAAPDRAELITLGSAHVTVGGTPSNIATTLLPRFPDRTIEHAKLRPILLAGATVSEGIAPRDEITVYDAGEMRIAICICRDLLDPGVNATLAATGTNVVLVPSMTPVFDPYEDAALQLVRASQAIVVIANGPLVQTGLSPHPVDGFHGRATPFRGAKWVSLRPGRAPRPTYVVFKPGH